jgi:light-regulated signal transduction histidine kinase (bacteriophytochrome)
MCLLILILQYRKPGLLSIIIACYQRYPTEIKQLFQNHFANAIKFRKKILLEIKISVQHLKDDWEFHTKTMALGSTNSTAKGYSSFSTLHTGWNIKVRASGYRIVKNCGLHNGKIWVESTPGMGVLLFTIPES